MGKNGLKLPRGVFNLWDVERLNAEMNPTQVRVKFGQAIAEGRVEVVRGHKPNGDQPGPLRYRQCVE